MCDTYTYTDTVCLYMCYKYVSNLGMVMLKLICKTALFSWFEDKHLQGLGILKLSKIKIKIKITKTFFMFT